MSGVLIVDDHEAFRVQARALLEAAGYSIVGEAQDVASAIKAVAELEPEIVLLDVQLPDGDGFSVADALEADGIDSRVVLISSRRAEDYGRRLASSPAIGFIHKPDLSRHLLEDLVGAPS